jgi:two-component system phosphate regulon response regulator PhoB
MVKQHICLIEDEEDIREVVEYNLRREGYRVTAVGSGEEALAAIAKDRPALILLDLMLPGIDGLELCRRLKKDNRTESIPVIMVTAKGEESDIVAGLELGAEDYITKPFGPKVLVARVRTVLRRNARQMPEDNEVIRLHDIEINPGRREVLVKGQAVELTFTEFGVLHALARRPGWVFTRYQIVNAVRGEDYPVTDRSVDVQVVGLRKKLGAAADCIETIRGVGYRMKE